jgi:hypothetical protein
MVHELAKGKLKGACGAAKTDPLVAKLILGQCIATDDPRLKPE